MSKYRNLGLGWLTIITILFCGISCDMRWHLDEMQRLSVVKTGEVSNIRNTKAVVAGNVEWDGDALLTERGICYSESAMPTISDEHVASGNTEGDFSAQIKGLTRNTAYRARAYAINEIGVAYGNIVYFTTADVLDTIPSLTTLQATEITPSSARVGGEITSDGGNEILERGICYSLEAAPDTSDAYVTTGGGDAPYSDILTGLEDGATYFARAYAINDMGIGYGNEISFQTPLQGLPVVITMDANVNGATTASLSGNVTSEGDAPVVTRGICYSTEPQPDVNDIVIASGSGAGFFNCNLTGLQEGNTYYARAYATNSIGTTYGNEVSFITQLGAIASILCEEELIAGTYIQGLPAVNGSLNLFYTGGNGGSYGSQTINSTGVIGLVASFLGGTFTIGSSSLYVSISGTPQTSGSAVFTILIGGQNCTFTIPVEAGSVGFLDCENISVSGNFTEGFPVNNASVTIAYSYGNGGTYNSQSIISTGVTGLTASITSGFLLTTGGNILMNISGTPYQSGLASFDINIGNQNCIVQLLVSPGHWEDDFTDGDFTANPPWFGDTNYFMIENGEMAHYSDQLASGQSSIYTASNFSSIENLEWRFSINQAFSGSASNQTRVYIVADSPPLSYSGLGSAGVSGYFLLFGESLGQDVIRFYRDDGLSVQLIASGTTNIGLSFNANIKVSRNQNGLWTLETDFNGGQNYILETSFTESTYNSSSFFGIICTYTASNANNFYFDRFYAGY